MDGLLRGLILVAQRAEQARYYATLENEDSSSGFYLKAQTARAASREVAGHLARYPVWRTGRIYLKATKERVKTIQGATA